MSELRRFDDCVWDRVFEFIYSCEPDASREEVQSDLRRLGIDIRSAISAVLQAVEAAKARARLHAAKQSRPAVVARMEQPVSPMPENLRGSLQQLIAQRFGTTEIAAHWYKLEKEASEEDLKSLLDDLHRLESLSEGPCDGESTS